MIQGGSEIVDSIAEEQSNVGTDVGDSTQDELRAVRFRVELGNTEIRVRVHESNPFPAQISDVIFGPFDLKEWATQI
jgi:hypothetical protein